MARAHIPFEAEGNLPVKPFSWAQRLQASVGDQVEENIHPDFHDDPRARSQYVAALLAERHLYQGAHGQVARIANRGVGHLPITGAGDGLPPKMISEERLARLGWTYNLMAMRRSVIQHQPDDHEHGLN